MSEQGEPARRRHRPVRRRTPRRWTVMPPLIRGMEPFVGQRILHEVRGPLGMLLWVAQRDVFLWAATPDEHRRGLFATEAAGDVETMLAATSPDPELSDAVDALLPMLRHPARTSPDAVRDACVAVWRYTERRGWLQTALAFVQQAALVDSRSAELAYAVGNLAHRTGDPARAEAWYRRTVALARAQGAWRVYAEAFRELATLYGERGEQDVADRFQERSARMARRFHMHDLLAKEEE